MRLLMPVLVLLALVPTAYAQSVEPPTYVVGDTWTYSDGRVIKVVKLEDGGGVLAGVNSRCPTCLYYLSKDLTIQKIEQEDGKPPESTAVGFVQTGFKFWDFPLEVKKKWNFSGKGIAGGTPQTYYIEVTIEAQEDVKTKAGTFKAFRIRRDWTIQTRDSRMRDNTWSQTIWYAPEVKQLVKWTDSRPAFAGWELTSYSVK